MKQPKLEHLKLDRKETLKIRAMALKKNSKIKITINIDEDTLDTLKEMAGKAGSSYQKLLNKLLREALGNYENSDSRLDRLEKEVKEIRKKLSA